MCGPNGSMCGANVRVFFGMMSAENRLSNYDEINDLLLGCYNEFKQHRFPRLIEP